jgi:hypothetical protein
VQNRRMATGEGPIPRLSDALMEEVESVACAEQRSAGEFVQEAVERLLRIKRRESLYLFGEGQVRKLGIQESDVPDLVHQVRGVTERGR